MILKITLALCVVAAAAFGYVRLAPVDADRFHVDPVGAAGTGKPNEAFLRPADSDVYALAPAELMARLEAVALAEPRTERVAGDPAAGFATYVQRSALWGFPDYVSARAVPEGEGTRLALWSRSRFGYGDMGVNAARVSRWTAALNDATR